MIAGLAAIRPNVRSVGIARRRVFAQPRPKADVNDCSIGVSGGTADQDETCAQAGIEAAKDALK